MASAEEQANVFAQAFIDLYGEIDGVADEMSDRDHRITQQNWPMYLAAKDYVQRFEKKQTEGERHG